MYVLISIILFGMLIAIHEFGHFITAKLCGVKVHEFAIGMGPLLFKKQGKETLYSLRLLPIGGYCSMEGENEESDDPHSFSAQHPLEKIFILIAGAAMNFLFGLVLLIIVFDCIAPTTSGILEILSSAWECSLSFIGLVWDGLKSLVSGAHTVDDMSGVVGIVGAMNDMGQASATFTDALIDLMYFGAFIAVNLAVMNLLPFPALDGGRIFFLMLTWPIEKLLGRKIDAKYEGYIHTIGLVLLLGLMVYVTFNDVLKIILK